MVRAICRTSWHGWVMFLNKTITCNLLRSTDQRPSWIPTVLRKHWAAEVFGGRIHNPLRDFLQGIINFNVLCLEQSPNQLEGLKPGYNKPDLLSQRWKRWRRSSDTDSAEVSLCGKSHAQMSLETQYFRFVWQQSCAGLTDSDFGLTEAEVSEQLPASLSQKRLGSVSVKNGCTKLKTEFKMGRSRPLICI